VQPAPEPVWAGLQQMLASQHVESCPDIVDGDAGLAGYEVGAEIVRVDRASHRVRGRH